MRKISLTEFLIGLAAFGFICLWIYRNIDINEWLEKDPSSPVHMTGVIAKKPRLKQVKVVQIPQDVYDTIKSIPKESKYLTGNKKYVVMEFTVDKTANQNVAKEIQKQMTQNGYSEYYRHKIMEIKVLKTVLCSSAATCSALWIMQNCSNGICLIHPQKHQAVIDSSLNPQQVAQLLEKYKEW